MTSDRAKEPRTWLGRVLRPGVDSSRSELVVGLGYMALMTVGLLTEAGRRLIREHADYPNAAFSVVSAFAFAVYAPDCVRLLFRRR